MKLPELPPDTAPAVRQAFEVLARESAELRAEVEALKGVVAARSGMTRTTGAPIETAPPVERRSAPAPIPEVVPAMSTPVAPPLSRVDMEKAVGRYGAWGAAALMILLGVGTLLEWAIRNGYFGPGARVALSSGIAVALAVGGYVLRERATAAGESRAYGNACLGLALGVLDVVAWQVGPRWHMLPPGVALVIADIGAAALVSLGVRENDELPAALGAAGLYLAPFVTSSGEGSAIVLATYIAVVSLVLFRFVEQDTWTVARVVIRWGSLMSLLALVAMHEAVLGAIVASVLALAMLRIDAPIAVRLKLVAAYIVAAIIATGAIPAGTSPTWSAALTPDRHTGWLASVALLITMVVVSRFTLLATTEEDFSAVAWSRPVRALLGRSALSLTFTLVFPVAAVLVAATALPGDTTVDAVVLCSISGLIALIVALRSDAPLAHEYFTTGIVLLWLGALSYSSREVRVSEALLLGVALVALYLVSTRPDVPIARLAAFAAAAFVTTISTTLMFAAESRPMSDAWLDIVLMAGACVALVLFARLRVENEREEVHFIRMLAPWIALLMLARYLVVLASGSYTAIALTTFYAATGVALIVMGRRRANLAMRRGGLTLALYAPLRAIGTAADVENTGVRVAVYFVAGAFMLLVAFLYRTRRASDAEPILVDVHGGVENR